MSFTPLIAFLAGYLLGSIPFGLILSRLAGLGDLRTVGSGNIGATNALRAGGWKLGLATLLLDMGKGWAAVFFAHSFGLPIALAAGAGAFVGHLYPVWLGFRGGKGVATMIGVSTGVFWPSGAAFAAVWVLSALVTRLSSLAGMGGAIAACAVAVGMKQWQAGLLFGAMALLLIRKHRANIARLRAGTEPKIGQKTEA